MVRRALVCAVAVLAAGCSPTPSGPTPLAASPSPSASVAATPFELPPPCTLEVGGKTAEIEVDRAVELTGLAAEALRGGEPPRRLVGALPATFANLPTARALLGYDGAALSCYHGQAVLRDQKLGPNGLTPRAEAMRRAIRRTFGPLPMGGFAAGGISTGHIDGSSHYDGRAMDIFFRPHTDRAQARRGWVLAHWLVARGAQYDVLSVIYRDRIWTVWASFSGWRDYVHPSGNRRNPILRHLDHVHTAVEGGPWRGDDD